MMFGARSRKDEEAADKIAVGYILMSQIPASKVMDVGLPMKAAAATWGYSWGGTYLDHAASSDTVAALERAATYNRAIALVVVPTEAHFPRGRQSLVTGHGSVRVVTADGGEPTADGEMLERGA